MKRLLILIIFSLTVILANYAYASWESGVDMVEVAILPKPLVRGELNLIGDEIYIAGGKKSDSNVGNR